MSTPPPTSPRIFWLFTSAPKQQFQVITCHSLAYLHTYPPCRFPGRSFLFLPRSLREALSGAWGCGQMERKDPSWLLRGPPGAQGAPVPSPILTGLQCGGCRLCPHVTVSAVFPWEEGSPSQPQVSCLQNGGQVNRVCAWYGKPLAQMPLLCLLGLVQ